MSRGQDQAAKDALQGFFDHNFKITCRAPLLRWEFDIYMCIKTLKEMHIITKLQAADQILAVVLNSPQRRSFVSLTVPVSLNKRRWESKNTKPHKQQAAQKRQCNFSDMADKQTARLSLQG